MNTQKQMGDPRRLSSFQESVKFGVSFDHFCLALRSRSWLKEFFFHLKVKYLLFNDLPNTAFTFVNSLAHWSLITDTEKLKKKNNNNSPFNVFLLVAHLLWARRCAERLLCAVMWPSYPSVVLCVHWGGTEAQSGYVSGLAQAGSDLVRIPVQPAMSQLLCLMCGKTLFSLRFRHDLKQEELGQYLETQCLTGARVGRGECGQRTVGFPGGSPAWVCSSHGVAQRRHAVWLP